MLLELLAAFSAVRFVSDSGSLGVSDFVRHVETGSNESCKGICYSEVK